MGNAAMDNRDLLLAMLADEALFSLSADQESELRALRVAHPGDDDGSFELAAAATATALASHAEAFTSLPADVAQRLDQTADSWIRRYLAGSPPADTVTAFKPPPGDAGLAAVRGGVIGWSGWLAAAACLVLAIGGWWSRGPKITTKPLAQQRQALLNAAADVVTVDWTATNDPLLQPEKLAGDVVWSTGAQSGFMSFRGLPANDPQRNQYQLWIFDARQDDRYPIDGGVFDVAPGQAEVVVPINAKIEVAEPTMFAVTLEKPGGVVVSSRERLLTIAKLPS